MERAAFEQIAAEEFANVSNKLAGKLSNLALLIEEAGDGALLGFYRGVPRTERGEGYGNLGTLPDTITLFYRPLLGEAEAIVRERRIASYEAVRVAIRETLWHEIAHHFGMDEDGVSAREEEGTNRYPH
ncbi:hypothetical protein A3H77_00945 [Candidatus Kaiserbacteria bacterium RIFCSPLOWO2_02_FULL_56_11]|uniref:Metallopeptidase family protein n=2 Tax=Candidatus Kaiseribacteriota TaxID=1752734 RepID=A0A1F6E1X7_9BACT|nr:MAG: hypothetical protein A3C95_00970 [Candidatus Kaiserbacteria bacterium RIFCSPHIGHO2_02_FULL_56_30]OGG72433.1 MAG: hypothetical protein A3E65_02870 [Candidatus Kaiserbacteria bacterium RIFCSPHIGHO2_12_FULL_56_13]OGG82300.1 MAG: hypothetical protein A3H77_00945 [Candidatus Kaiserbacteria bacterium RIFCSPLOWO2_02_FULL_56_11]